MSIFLTSILYIGTYWVNGNEFKTFYKYNFLGIGKNHLNLTFILTFRNNRIDLTLIS